MQILVGTGLYQNRFPSGLKQWIRKKNQIKKCDFAFTIHNISVRNNSLMVVIAIDESTKCMFCVYSSKENIKTVKGSVIRCYPESSTTCLGFYGVGSSFYIKLRVRASIIRIFQYNL